MAKKDAKVTITVTKAIETVKSIKHVCRGLFPPEEQAALSISIEALKLVDWIRQGHIPASDFYLPGEAKGSNNGRR